MNDSIYRQAAIDVVRKCPVKEVTPAYMLIDKAEVMTELMQLPSAQPANSSKISYSVICEKFPNPHIYFNTYDEAEHWARFNQPNYRPYYIIKRSEHFEIVGEAK